MEQMNRVTASTNSEKNLKQGMWTKSRTNLMFHLATNDSARFLAGRISRGGFNNNFRGRARGRGTRSFQGKS